MNGDSNFSTSSLAFVIAFLIVAILVDIKRCLCSFGLHFPNNYWCCTAFHMLACILSHCSHVQLLVTLWIVTCQAPWALGFSRQEYLSGLPCPPPGDLPNPGSEHHVFLSLALQVDSLPTEPLGSPGDIFIAHLFLLQRHVYSHPPSWITALS